MYYRIPLGALPEVRECHIHTRKTVWNCSHQRNTLVYIREGSCKFNINEIYTTLSAGHILLIPAEQNYTRYPIDNTECKMVYLYFKTTSHIEVVAQTDIPYYLGRFEEEIADNILTPSVEFQEIEKEIFISDHIDTGEHAEEIYQILDTISKQLASGQRYRQMYNAARLLEILATLGQISISDYRGNSLSTHNHYPIQLEKAIIYITKNYREKITMSELCKYCNVSSQHLIRLFHTHMNTTPVQYINKNKISHAIELLRTTELSVSEISYELGFSDAGYFSRLFKKIEKRSPNEARSYIMNYDKKQQDTDKSAD